MKRERERERERDENDARGVRSKEKEVASRR
jgi:hypothetical protein